MDSEIGWLGITDKYWLAALIPDQQTPFKARMLSQPSSVGDQIEDRLYQTDLQMAMKGNSHTTYYLLGQSRPLYLIVIWMNYPSQILILPLILAGFIS